MSNRFVLLPAACLVVLSSLPAAAGPEAPRVTPRALPEPPASGLAVTAQFVNLSTLKQAIRYLARHRADVALVAFTARPDASIDAADPTIMHNPDEPMPLASTFKITVLAAYAWEVAAGRLDPAEPVTVGDWERFYLPSTEGGAHANALAARGLGADELGFARDRTAALPLDAIAGAMISVSDNAATDLLMDRLGAALAETIDLAGMTGQEVPRSILGTLLSWGNDEDGPLSAGRLARLLAMTAGAYDAEVARLAELYQRPNLWAAELAWRAEGGAEESIWNEIRAVHGLSCKGTARDYATVMARVVTGTLLSPEACTVMRRHLEWPMQLPGMDGVFSVMGNKSGSLLGVLTSASYFVPKIGDFPGRPRIVVLLARRIPVLEYLKLERGGALGMVEMRVALSRANAAEVAAALR